MAGPSLPPEIIFDILTRLPAKSLGRFRCVSKPWLSLLSEPQFLRSYLQIKQVLPESILISSYRCKLKISENTEYSFVIIPQSELYWGPLGNRVARHLFDEMPTVVTKITSVERHYSVLAGCGTCDGLVLDEHDKEFPNWFITNPITKEMRVLPDISREMKSNKYKYVIGYDHAKDDYKVVAFALDGRYVSHFNVYSVRNGSWKGIQVFLSCEYGNQIALAESGVPLNGRIHCINQNATEWDPAAAVIAFDMVEEKFYNIHVPSSTCGNTFRYNSCLVVLQGCLGYVSRIGESDKAQVWVMKEYGVEASWTKTIIVEVGECPEWLSWPLLTMLGGSELVVKKNWDYPTKFAIWNLDGGTLKDLVLQGLPADDDNGDYYERSLDLRGTFMETLISPYYNCNTHVTKKRKINKL